MAKDKQQDFYLWPPNPRKRSWREETPMEGIHVGLVDGDTGGCISEFHSDCQGHFILDEREDWQWRVLNFKPTNNREYLTAYACILAALHKFTGKKPAWNVLAGVVLKALIAAGWREVVYDHADGVMRWKSELPYKSK